MRRLIPALMLVLLVGCSRTTLNMSRSIDADNAGKTYDLEATAAEQTIKVVATAEGGPIDVFIYLTKNKAAVEREIMTTKLVNVLAEKQNAESVELQAKIPAKEEASVLVRSSTLKKTKASLKITN